MRIMFIVAFAVCICGSAFAAEPPDILTEWDSIRPPPAPAIQKVTIDPKRTAFFAISFNKNNCIPSDRPRCHAVIPNVKRLLDQARAHNMIIVMTHTRRMTPADFVPELKPIGGEIVFGGEEDKFHNNKLAEDLKARGIDTILMTGTSANGGLLLTATGAALRGFKVIVPIDTMPAATAYQEQFAIWQIATEGVFTNENFSLLTRSDLVDFAP